LVPISISMRLHCGTFAIRKKMWERSECVHDGRIDSDDLPETSELVLFMKRGVQTFVVQFLFAIIIQGFKERLNSNTRKIWVGNHKVETIVNFVIFNRHVILVRSIPFHKK